MVSVLTNATSIGLPIDLQVQLFDAMITPILLYDLEVVLGYESHSLIVKLHLKFCKILLIIKYDEQPCALIEERYVTDVIRK